MKKIGIFNHKGGVSKTTTAFNLGWIISKKNKNKVLLIDADSQCNLTLYALGYNGYQDFYEKNNGHNIKDALEPAFKAMPKLIGPSECIQLKRNKNLFLLPGHLDLSEYEVSLGVSFQLSNALGTMKNLPGAFNFLVEQTAKKYDIDYVIIDMNPSLSALNQDIILSCDYFIVPTSPDYFSFMAVKSLARVLPQWEKWAKNARSVFQDADYPMPQNTPKFLGYTINDFNLSKGRVTYSFEVIMDMISNEVRKTLLPKLHEADMTLPKTKYEETAKLNNRLKSQREIDNYCLAEISNFNKLIAESNKKSIPIFEISPNNLHWNQRKTLNWFNTLFNVLGEKIIKLTYEK